MIRLRKKQKIPQPLDEGRMRQIIQEELKIYDDASRDKDSKEQRKKIIRKRIMNLPKNQRAQLVRYLKSRKGEHGKK